MILTAAATAFILLFLSLRAKAKAGLPSDSTRLGERNPADAGRQLRQMMLTMRPQETGTTPTKDFPRVYGLLMDWPIGKDIATVFSAGDGSASLYTTSTFGIIGGEAHESVRNAAKSFVRAADQQFLKAAPVQEYPYPTSDHVRFYLLTFEGVRMIDTDFASIANGTNEYAELFGLGQAVLTELRRTAEKPAIDRTSLKMAVEAAAVTRRETIFPGLSEGFTFKPQGRSGFVYYKESNHVLEIYWEMSGVPEFDILISPLEIREWTVPPGCPISPEKQKEIVAGLGKFLVASKVRADI